MSSSKKKYDTYKQKEDKSKSKDKDKSEAIYLSINRRRYLLILKTNKNIELFSR